MTNEEKQAQLDRDAEMSNERREFNALWMTRLLPRLLGMNVPVAEVWRHEDIAWQAWRAGRLSDFLKVPQ